MEPKEPQPQIKSYILDDDPRAIDRFELLLHKAGNIEIVGREINAGMAVREIAKIQPDIVFLDIVMPDRTGFEVIDAIRDEGINSCFIFVTGHTHYSIRAIKTAAFDYLVKPVDVDELKETLERYRMMHPMLPANHNSQIASLDQLSCREKEIVSYLAEGLTSREISEKLSLSKNTVDTHRRNILDKSGLRSTAELIRYWVG